MLWFGGLEFTLQKYQGLDARRSMFSLIRESFLDCSYFI